MVSSLIFQKFSGEGLTEPPPQTPPPAFSRASPSVRASPSILGRFAPLTRASLSISILGRFAPSIRASPSTFDWGPWFGPPQNKFLDPPLGSWCLLIVWSPYIPREPRIDPSIYQHGNTIYRNRNRTHNLVRHKNPPIPLGHSNGSRIYSITEGKFRIEGNHLPSAGVVNPDFRSTRSHVCLSRLDSWLKSWIDPPPLSRPLEGRLRGGDLEVWRFETRSIAAVNF